MNSSQSHQKHSISLSADQKILKPGNKFQQRSYELYSNMPWPSVTRSCLSHIRGDIRFSPRCTWVSESVSRPSRAGTDPLCQALLVAHKKRPGVWLLLILCSFIMGSAGISCERELCFTAAGEPQIL